jgi:hypothetical protein
MKTFLKKLKFKVYYFFLFKIKTFIRRKVSRLFKYNRPSSYPYITGDSFRSLATHIYDELQEVDVENVVKNDIVFVRGDFLHTYFKKVHPKIQNPYILISHHSDENIDSTFEKYIDGKIIHWFAQNLMIRHEKCTPIPIGLQLRMYDNENKTLFDIEKYRNNNKKINKIFYAFSVETNLNRLITLKSLSLSNVTTKPDKKLSLEEYYSIVSKHAFNASPEGNGVDCHRTWETLYLGSIPVLEKSINSEYWKKIGLPVLTIDSWNDVKNFNESFLDKKYKETTKNGINSPLYMDYWIKEIYNKKV